MHQEERQLLGLFIAATLGPPFVNGCGDFLKRRGYERLGRVVSATLPAVVRVAGVWGAFKSSAQMHHRLRDIEMRLPRQSRRKRDKIRRGEADAHELSPHRDTRVRPDGLIHG